MPTTDDGCERFEGFFREEAALFISARAEVIFRSRPTSCDLHWMQQEIHGVLWRQLTGGLRDQVIACAVRCFGREQVGGEFGVRFIGLGRDEGSGFRGHDGFLRVGLLAGAGAFIVDCRRPCQPWPMRDHQNQKKPY